MRIRILTVLLTMLITACQAPAPVVTELEPEPKPIDHWVFACVLGPQNTELCRDLERGDLPEWEETPNV